jgi:hypothetical protein
MTMYAQPIHALVPGVGPFVGDVPEDRHVERVVQMMLDFLGELTKQVQPQLDEAMGTRIGGSLNAQQRLLERIEGVRSPPLIPSATAMDFAATMNDANGAHTGVCGPAA